MAGPSGIRHPPFVLRFTVCPAGHQPPPLDISIGRNRGSIPGGWFRRHPIHRYRHVLRQSRRRRLVRDQAGRHPQVETQGRPTRSFERCAGRKGQPVLPRRERRKQRPNGRRRGFVRFFRVPPVDVRSHRVVIPHPLHRLHARHRGGRHRRPGHGERGRDRGEP